MSYPRNFVDCVELVSGLLVYVAIMATATAALTLLLVPPAHAQDVLVIPGSDMETTEPTYWMAGPSSNDFGYSTDYYRCGIEGDQYIRTNTGAVQLEFDLPAAYQAQDDTTIQIEYRTAAANSYQSSITVVSLGLTAQDNGTASGNQVQTVDQPLTGWVTMNTATYPAHVAPVNNDAVKMRVTWDAQGRTCIDDVVVTLTNAAIAPGGDTGGGDTGGGGSSFPDPLNSESWFTDATNGLFDDFDTDSGSWFDQLENFQCGGLSSLIPKKRSGGGLLGKILKGIITIVESQINLNLGQNKANCLATEGNSYAEASAQSLTDLEPTQNVTLSTSSLANPASSQTAAEQMDVALASYDVGDDNVVTASNRTNRLLVANMRMQAAMTDRMLGGRTRAAFETEGGTITAADAAANPNYEFPEDDIEATRDGVRSLSDQIKPDYEELTNAPDALPEETGAGGCLALGATPPSGDGSEGAMSTLRWNAAQKLAGSNLGEFICSIVDQPPRSTVEICLGPDAVNVSGIDAFANTSLCAYGPDAPAYSNFALNALPLIMMMLAGLAVFKMFFN